MSPIITQTILAAVIATLGWMGKTLWTSVQEYRRGRKDEAQRIAKKLEDQKAETRRIRQEYDYFRAWVLAQDALTADQLAKMPKPPPRDHN